MTNTQRSSREGIAAAAIIIALACGDGTDDDGPTGNTGSIQLSASATALSVQQQSSGSITVTVARGGGFTGVVTLAVSGLPTGATATVDPTQLSGSTVTATVTVTVAASLTPGTHTATITATGTGVAQATVTFALTVVAAADYAISLTPGALMIAAGGNSNATINIERSNFTGGVSLALVNAPTGITGVFTPAPSTTSTSALTIAIATSVTPGNYPLTIRGTATGVADRTVALQLTVIAAPTAGNNVEFLYCNPSHTPVFFAYQDGTGPWQAVAPSTSGGATRFAFNLSSGRGGVLQVTLFAPSGFVRRSGAGRRRAQPGTRMATNHALGDTYATEVTYATTSELAKQGALTCAQTLPGKIVRGTVVGVPAGQYGFVSLGSTTEIFDGAVGTNPVTFLDVQGGLVDFVGARSRPVGTPDRVLVFRDLLVPDGGMLPSTIDFNGPASLVPVSASVDITGAAAGERLEVYSELVTATSYMQIWSDLSPSVTTPRPWAGLGAAAMRTGDFHGVLVFSSASNSPEFRVASKYVATVSNQTLALGPIANAATTSQVVAGAYPRFRFQGTLPAEYPIIHIGVESGDESNAFDVTATSAYLAAIGNPLTFDLTMPDISGFAGFPASARLTPGSNTVTTDAFAFIGPWVSDERPALGTEFKASVRTSTVIVP